MEAQPTDPLAPIRDTLSLQEVADAFGVSAPTVRSAIARGELQAYRVFNRIVIPRDGIATWLESKRIQPAGSTAVRNPDFVHRGQGRRRA